MIKHRGKNFYIKTYTLSWSEFRKQNTYQNT